MRAASLALVVMLSGCASAPRAHDDVSLQREAIAGTNQPVPAPIPLNTGMADNKPAAGTPELSLGSGRFIHPAALSTPRPPASGDGAVTFNFENQPVQAVVKAILGDLLKQNYTIVPGVEGNISFSTSKPVDSSQALPILETLLSWTDNALIKRAGGYVVMPKKGAVAGNIVPSLGAAAPAGGMQARLFPLEYISATEMKKLIEPFAGKDAVLLVDPARNLLVMAGTPDELKNYQSMIRGFDVDWLRGMSVGVFNLKYAKVGELMPKMNSMFGMQGNTPLAGMFRFIPIERTNALVVISTQPDYLTEIGNWIARIDRGGGNEPQLFVYDVRNIKASDLAGYLAQIYASGGGGGGGDMGGQVGPGLSGGTLGSANNASATGMGSTAGSFGSSADSAMGDGGRDGGASSGFNVGGDAGGRDGGTASGGSFGNASSGFGASAGNTGSSGSSSGGGQQYSSSDGSVRISSVDGSNQLLVRARPSQWEEIKQAIEKLDHVPLQVQIETRILEVSLTGEFQFGVQWYLQGLTGSTGKPGTSDFEPGQPYRHRQLALGNGGNLFGGESFFYSFLNSNLQVAIRAMETSGNTKTLSAPSMVVMNNQQATIQVGERIPINSTSVNTGIDNTTSYSQVNYINTGVILNVQPRINPGGLVYLTISQEVSQADKGAGLVNGNPTISQRKLATQVAVQSGQTVLLGGLIKQAEGSSDTGIPGLNRIPILGRLFGHTSHSRNRTELIVLITPRVIRGGQDAKRVTNDYMDKFESLKPLRAERDKAAVPAAVPVAATTTPLPSAPAVLSWAEQLQQHAEAALRQKDFVNAQAMALQSWKQGTRHGNLCQRNWQVVVQARQHSSPLGSVDAARKQQARCMQAASP